MAVTPRHGRRRARPSAPGRTMMRRRVVLLVAGVMASGTWAQSDARAASSSAPLPTKSAEVNEITVEVTPIRVDERGAVLEVVLDTHQGDLDVNLRTRSKLTVDGTKWPVGSYRGDPPGGHHREGTLRFEPAGQPQGTLRLVINGLGEKVTLRWRLGTAKEDP